MKLQIAADTLLPEELLDYFEKANQWIDILELGTPFLLRYGADIIAGLRKISDSVEILCDSKIMDAGYYEAEELYRAGADYATVLAVTEDSTLKDAVRAAKAYGKKLMADMICVRDLPQTVKRLEAAGTDVIAVHTGVDQQKQGRTPLTDLMEMKRAGNRCEIAVAGGIRFETLSSYLEQAPDIIIVGGGVFQSPDPATETKKLYEAVRAYEAGGKRKEKQ